jgi:hypothetical protein
MAHFLRIRIEIDTFPQIIIILPLLGSFELLEAPESARDKPLIRAFHHRHFILPRIAAALNGAHGRPLPLHLHIFLRRDVHAATPAIARTLTRAIPP